ncbi:S1 family peptidase [Streptomyces calvus]|uniref:Streptogrisin D n=1 Tax=Streptomyces calvus TaxID=67282 RepID=A0AA40SFN9_9ACTN|nr:S1 family peptidase [Streptomyces calvus]MBA8945519.1 streptogrisin D [Streptomyces calvus]GGP59785.1 protease [Streptomyces calvus]
MSHQRIPKRRTALAAGGVLALGAAAILLPHANASQDGASQDGASQGAATAPRTLGATDAPGLAARLAGQLGDAFAGSYYDSAGRRLVVNVVPDGDGTAAERAKRAGAVVREVDNSMTELDAGTRTLTAEAAVPGTSWAVDPRTNKILVTADSTVTGDRWNRLESTVRGLGPGLATIRKSQGTFRTFASGGDAIFAGGSRCSLGFNVTAGDGTPAFLTAGHCGVAAEQWSDTQGGQPIATVDQAVFPGAGDFALVRYDDPATVAPSEVDLGEATLAISQAAQAAVGQEVFRMGSTTGLADGQVLGLNATVNYPEGTVTGLIQTDVCAEPGDSGGAMFTRDGLAIGLTSGGSGDCTSGGETFFQPVTTALEAVGATLGDAGGEQAGGEQAPGAGGEAGAGQEPGGDGTGDRAGGAETGAGRDPGAGTGQDSGPAGTH